MDLAARHLAALVASSDDAIVSKDPDGIVLSWNKAAERLFGYTAEEMIGTSIRRIIPNERQHEEDETLARIRRGQQVSHFDTERRRKDGTIVPVSLTISPIFGPDGRVIGASKIARNITERRQAEQERARLLALAQQHAFVNEKLNDVGKALASALDPQTVVQAVTDAATQLTRAEFGAFFYKMSDAAAGGTYTFSTLSGTLSSTFSREQPSRESSLFELPHHGDVVVRLDDATQDARFRQHPPTFGLASGQAPVRSYLAVPVRDRTNAAIGRLFFGSRQVGVFDEAAERLAVGLALWATVALENARLYADAEEAGRLKDEFLATLSHELRTPLNAIVGYTRMMRSGLLAGAKFSGALETVDRNASSLTQIVEDVLDVSRIIAGKIRLDVGPVDLARVVQDASQTVRPAADAKGLKLETVIDPHAAPVSGDPERLQQIVWNLLSNAVKFTPRGGTVQARVEGVDAHVDLIVSDTGIGIPPAFLPHVFERFRQADGSIARERGGLGLGLAIVRHLVELHGGTVAADSGGDGQGATFRVTLPVMQAQLDQTGAGREAAQADAVVPRLTPPTLTGTRIVAVDDDRDALGLLREILVAAGAEVHMADSARAALALLPRVHPQVLLADIGMPHMDGFELIAEVRASVDPVVRTTPAAALTAYARSEDRARALQSGFQVHLSKPIDPTELLTAIATLSRRGRLE